MPIIFETPREGAVLYRYCENDWDGTPIYGKISRRTKTTIYVNYWYKGSSWRTAEHACGVDVFHRLWIPLGKIYNRREV